MNKIHINTIVEEEDRSPKGKYHSFSRQVSVALGRDRESMDLTRRHPFDLEIVRIPPGACLCPFHFHSAQWELYLVISGRGLVRDDLGITEVTAGDAFFFRPGEAHQICNGGVEDLVYHVIADNPVGEGCFYPDSRKWLAVGPDGRTIIKGSPADYYDGEE